MNSNSVDKIITTYFSSVTAETFTYNKKIYKPMMLRVSPMVLRLFSCPVNCGGCCHLFSLDYISAEKNRPKKLVKNIVQFNNKEVEVLSDLQTGISSHYCGKLNLQNGRCKIHKHNPLSCDFEPLRFKIYKDKNMSVLGCYPYGRGWSFVCTDGSKGAKCKFINSISKENRENVIKKLERLQLWANHFGIETKIPKIISAIRSYKLQYNFLNF